MRRYYVLHMVRFASLPDAAWRAVGIFVKAPDQEAAKEAFHAVVNTWEPARVVGQFLKAIELEETPCPPTTDSISRNAS